MEKPVKKQASWPRWHCPGTFETWRMVPNQKSISTPNNKSSAGEKIPLIRAPGIIHERVKAQSGQSTVQ
jgi:hypothetical protein